MERECVSLMMTIFSILFLPGKPLPPVSKSINLKKEDRSTDIFRSH